MYHRRTGPDSITPGDPKLNVLCRTLSPHPHPPTMDGTIRTTNMSQGGTLSVPEGETPKNVLTGNRRGKVGPSTSDRVSLRRG